MSHDERNFWQAPLYIVLFLVLWLIAAAAHGEVIEYVDNDPSQWLMFSPDSGLCDTTVLDSIAVWVQIDPDSGYSAHGSPLIDSINSTEFKYISPDRDSLDNLIPGHYVGEYWYYTVTHYGQQSVLSRDTVHQTVDYWIIGGCMPIHRMDR